MQIKGIYLVALLISGLSISTVASCSQTNGVKLEWRQVSINNFLIDATLPSGVEVKGIRYREAELSKDWLLQVKSTSGTVVQAGLNHPTILSQQEFNELFSELILSIKKNNDGQLDRVHLGLGLIAELWEDTVSYLKKGAVPSSYRLKPKDLILAKKISIYLKSTSILKILCSEVRNIKKDCENNFVDMNPITFESEHIGKEWNQVEMLPNLGIPQHELWFGLELADMTHVVAPAKTDSANLPL